MADSNSKQLPKVGLSPEEWLKMWETPCHESDLCSADDGNQDHSHDHHGEHEEEHCHSMVSESDKHGNILKVDSYLFRHVHSLTGGNTDETVFVSLCGDSKDLEWLCSKGYSVVGAELSEKAVKQVFEKACAGPIPYDVSTKGEVKIYSATDGKSLKVFVGDFLKDGICPEELGKFNCIWDSHGLCSLPFSLHQSYADKLLTFLNPGGKILISTADYDISKLKEGPLPAPVSCSKLAEYFSTSSVEQLERGFEPGEFGGLDGMYNPIVLVVAP